MESSVQRVLNKDDFAWLDLPSPVPLDTVRNAPADQLLSLVGEAAFISDNSILERLKKTDMVALPVIN